MSDRSRFKSKNGRTKAKKKIERNKLLKEKKKMETREY